MKRGDLVTMDNHCGGSPGELKCKTALVVDVKFSHHESVQVDSQVYRDREVYECMLVCECGLFEEYHDRLGLIGEV